MIHAMPSCAGLTFLGVSCLLVNVYRNANQSDVLCTQIVDDPTSVRILVVIESAAINGERDRNDCTSAR